MIDNIWYNAEQVQQYLPKQVGIRVEYNVDNQDTLQFIRTVSNSSYPTTAPQPTQQRPRPRTARKTYNTTQPPKPTQPSLRDTSIVKQVIFKGAVEIVKNFTFSSVEEATAALSQVYSALEAQYLQRLT